MFFYMYENMAEFCLLGYSRNAGTDDKKERQARQARQAWEVVKSAKRQPEQPTPEAKQGRKK